MTPLPLGPVMLDVVGTTLSDDDLRARTAMFKEQIAAVLRAVRVLTPVPLHIDGRVDLVGAGSRA